MERVVGRPVALDLGEDVRAARLGVLELLQHDDARALAHDEAIALLVPRARGLLGRVVEAGGESARRGETGQPKAADRRLRATSDHHVGIVQGDQPRGIADGVRPGRAGGDDGVIGALEAIPN